MGRVHQLDNDIVALISAGEVIENPSSVVKELIENSLDAGATQIEIEIQEGGIKSIIVNDNGTGILRDDVPLCIQRYTTSKISSKSDIECVETYGFRGEALASIAAVAELIIQTQHVNEEIGTQLVARPNEAPVVTSISRPPGTRVEVRDLFALIPARRKHLQDPRFEGMRVHEVILKHAIIRTDVGFKFIRDGETMIDCPENQSPRDRVLTLWGVNLAKNLVEIDYEEDDVHITGFIVRPPYARGNRNREYFSVLRRPIEETRFSKAVERAYSTLLMRGKFPICSLNIEMNISKVDPNVHPTKREVRIVDIDRVVQTIFRAVKGALAIRPKEPESRPLVEPQDHEEPVRMEVPSEVQPKRSSDDTQVVQIEQTRLLDHMQLIRERDLEVPEQIINLAELGGEFRVIGQFQRVYLLLEFKDALVIVDQHAAHERVLYERLRENVNRGNVTVQELIQPFVIRLNPQDAERVIAIQDILEKIGFEITSFGGNEILISAVPDVLGRIASEPELISLIDRVMDIGAELASDEFMDEMIKLTACHSAIRAGQAMSNEEIAELLTELAKTQDKFACCHGRPSLILLPRDMLDKRFGRLDPDAIERYRARHRTDS